MARLESLTQQQLAVAPVPATPTALQTYRRLLGYVRPHAAVFSLGLVGVLIYSASMVSFAKFSQTFGNSIEFAHRDPHTLRWLPVALVGLFMVRGLGDFTQTYCMGYVSRHVVNRLRGQLFERVLRLPIGFFDGHSSATLLSRLTYNTEQVAQATTDSVVVISSTALTITALIGYLLWIDLRLAVLALIMAPLVTYLVTIVNRYFRRYSRRIQDSMSDVTRIAKEGFEAPRVVKVYNAEEHLARQFDEVNEHNRRSNMKLILIRGLANPIVQSLTAIGGAVILSYAIAGAIRGQMTMGDLLGFLTALGMLAQPLRQLMGASGPLQQGIAAAQSLFELLDEPAESAGGDYRAQRVRGEVQFEHAGFRYPRGNAAALREVNLQVRSGENVAVVGRSGSGKSTLVSLLPRFYDVSSGCVRIDGRDVRDYELRNLRQQIAVVSQEVVLFNDTIRRNIAFGREIDAAALERAAEAAHVLEFTRLQPHGLDTLVGDRGVLLSGGQRQRIAIARALLKDAPILILDEATSALDTEAERHIQAALAQLVRNRTTFVIAHRLSTVEQADRIVVLDAGALVESGTHTELIAHGGLYAQLHRLQFSD